MSVLKHGIYAETEKKRNSTASLHAVMARYPYPCTDRRQGHPSFSTPVCTIRTGFLKLGCTLEQSQQVRSTICFCVCWRLATETAGEALNKMSLHPTEKKTTGLVERNLVRMVR
jgi:hypothetical protein